MFRTTKVNADLFEFVYASLFHVSIPCKRFIPTVSNISITRFGKASTRYRDDFPKLSTFLLKTAQWFISESNATTVREVSINIISPPLFIQLGLIDHSLPGRLLVILCSTPIPTCFAQHQIPNGNYRASVLGREF